MATRSGQINILIDVNAASKLDTVLVVMLDTDARIGSLVVGDCDELAAALYESARYNNALKAAVMLAASAFVEGDYTKEEIVEQAKNIGR